MVAFVKICLSFSVGLLLAGIFLVDLRHVLIPLGVCSLFFGYLVEKISILKIKYNLPELRPRSEIQGALFGVDADILISSKWDLKGCQRISSMRGDYGILIAEKFSSDCSLISGIVFKSGDDSSVADESGNFNVNVDTGWMMFMLDSKPYYSPAQLEKMIQKKLKSLPDNEPLCLWLEDGEGRIIGVVVSTGSGDGTYVVEYKIKEGFVTEIQVKFIED